MYASAHALENRVALNLAKLTTVGKCQLRVTPGFLWERPRCQSKVGDDIGLLWRSVSV